MNNHQKSTVFTIINAAITGQQVIQIKLKNTWRTVEPYLVGLQLDTQELILYGYSRDSVSGYPATSRWEVFHLNEVDDAELTSYSFLPHVDYTGRVDVVQPVYRRLKPLFNAVTPGGWPVRAIAHSIRKVRLSK